MRGAAGLVVTISMVNGAAGRVVRVSRLGGAAVAVDAALPRSSSLPRSLGNRVYHGGCYRVLR